ncbi:Ldh family oxidoreductase [Bradyrhizobium agreste]|uniref:Ldh family oxidoreductase n=1 Tax=Bradyrhizobium agreste TaxID=2751811 RepID=UPI0018D9E309|nr:Ldh family oxidoreductase [Bradyrhizobium agreste]
MKGFMVPVGGPKGYALTLTVGLLSTMLSGALFGRDVSDLYAKTSEPQNSGHLFGVLPVAAFDEPASYAARMQKAIGDIKSAKRAPGVQQIFLPGEREYLAKMTNLAQGVPIGPALAHELSLIAACYNVPFKL